MSTHIRGVIKSGDLETFHELSEYMFLLMPVNDGLINLWRPQCPGIKTFNTTHPAESQVFPLTGPCPNPSRENP